MVMADKYKSLSVLKDLDSLLFKKIVEIDMLDDDSIDLEDVFQAASVGYSANTPALSTAQETLVGSITSKLSFLLQEPDTKVHLLALLKERPELALQILGSLECESLDVLTASSRP